MDPTLYAKFYDLESILRQHVLAVPIHHPRHLSLFRVVFKWDGFHIGLVRNLDPPPPSPTEVKQGADAFLLACKESFINLELPKTALQQLEAIINSP